LILTKESDLKDVAEGNCPEAPASAYTVFFAAEYRMTKSFEVSERRLLRASTNLQRRFAEVSALREAVRIAEAAKRCRAPLLSTTIIQPSDIEVRA